MPKFFIKVLNQNVFLFYNSNLPKRKIIWNYFSPCCIPDFFQHMLFFIFYSFTKNEKGGRDNNSEGVDIFKIIFVFLNNRRYSCINYKTVSPAFQVELKPPFSFCLTPPPLPSDFICPSARLLFLFLLESNSRNQTYWIFTFYISIVYFLRKILPTLMGGGNKSGFLQPCPILFHATFPTVETIHLLHPCPLAKGPAQHSAPIWSQASTLFGLSYVPCLARTHNHLSNSILSPHPVQVQSPPAILPYFLFSHPPPNCMWEYTIWFLKEEELREIRDAKNTLRLLYKEAGTPLGSRRINGQREESMKAIELVV